MTTYEPGALAEARRRLQAAPDEMLVRSLTTCLSLVAPTGYTAGDRKAWLTAAAMTLKGIPAHLLERGVSHACRTCDHPSKVVPAILDEVRVSWEQRRADLARETDALAKHMCQPEPEIVRCTPEQAAEIMREFGLNRNPLDIAKA